MPQALILSYITWNPPRIALTLPYVDIDIMWYGIFFALGFILGYLIFIPIATRFFHEQEGSNQKEIDWASARKRALSFTDTLVWYVVIGTIIGARLGHVFFYDWEFYKADPVQILMIRNGGLASHGATVGIVAALLLFLKLNKSKYPGISIIRLIDLICIPVIGAGCFIRIGNFFNQEIVGTPTNGPWAILFQHPAEGVPAVPRHPAQLYEAAAYLFTFFILFFVWRRWGSKLKVGVLSGLFFILVFGSRFVVEFVKLPQGPPLFNGPLETGQYLSIPLVLLGCALLVWPRKTLSTNKFSS